MGKRLGSYQRVIRPVCYDDAVLFLPFVFCRAVVRREARRQGEWPVREENVLSSRRESSHRVIHLGMIERDGFRSFA